MKQSKSRSAWPARQREGSVWELLLFAVLFVVFFTVAARAWTPAKDTAPARLATGTEIGSEMPSRFP